MKKGDAVRHEGSITLFQIDRWGILKLLFLEKCTNLKEKPVKIFLQLCCAGSDV